MALSTYLTTRDMLKLLGIDDAQIAQLATNADSLVPSTRSQELSINDPEDLISIQKYVQYYPTTAKPLGDMLDVVWFVHNGEVKPLDQDVWLLGDPQPAHNLQCAKLDNNNNQSFLSWYFTLRLTHVIYLQQEYAQLHHYFRITQCAINSETDLWQFLTLVYSINKQSADKQQDLIAPNNKIALWRSRTKCLLVLFVAKTFGKEDLPDDEYLGKTVWEILSQAKIFNPLKLLIALIVIGSSSLWFVWSYMGYSLIGVLLLIATCLQAWMVFPVLLGLYLAWMRSHDIIALLTIIASPINHLLIPLAQKLSQKNSWPHLTVVTLVSGALLLAAALCLYVYIAFPVSSLLTMLFMTIRVLLVLASLVFNLVYKNNHEPIFEQVMLLVGELGFYWLVFPMMLEPISAGFSVLFWLSTIVYPVLPCLNDRFNIVHDSKIWVNINDDQLRIFRNTAASTNYVANFLFYKPLDVKCDNITTLLQDHAKKTGTEIDQNVLAQVTKNSCSLK